MVGTKDIKVVQSDGVGPAGAHGFAHPVLGGVGGFGEGCGVVGDGLLELMVGEVDIFVWVSAVEGLAFADGEFLAENGILKINLRHVIISAVDELLTIML